MLYDVGRDIWSFPLEPPARSRHNLRQTIPQKLCLTRTFSKEEAVYEDGVEFWKRVKGACPEDYLPPDLLGSLHLEDRMKRDAIERKAISWNKLATVRIGESDLLVHPSGIDGGRMVCFSRLLPWYLGSDDDSEVARRFQCLPRDFCEWEECGPSSVRNIRNGPSLCVMNDECVNVFDCDRQDDPAWIGSSFSPYSAPLQDCLPITKDTIVFLDEAGHMWGNQLGRKEVDDFIVAAEEPIVKFISEHPSRIESHFLAATNASVFMFDRRVRGRFEFATGLAGICSLKGINETLLAVGDEKSFSVFDLRLGRTPVLQWDPCLAFSGPVRRIEPFTSRDETWLVLDNESGPTMVPLSPGPQAVQHPQRIACSEGKTVGAAVLPCAESMALFRLFDDGSAEYVNMEKSESPEILGRWDPLLGVTPSHDFPFEIESSLKRNLGKRLLPKELASINYGFIWNWLWYGRAELPSNVVPVPESHASFGLGEKVTEEIAKVLDTKPSSGLELDVASLTPVAHILLSRWAESS